MTPQTLKLIMLFFLTAALLNVTNYLFYWLYDPPLNKAVKVSLSLKLPMSRIFSTRPTINRTVNWREFLLCTNRSTHKSSPARSTSGEVVFYYNESAETETNSYYYYNGIRRGPVMCPKEPIGLGPVKPKELIDLDVIENLYSVLQPGGIYEERECTPRQTVALIVAFRKDESQLIEFLYSIHPILMKQQLEYQIFVVESGQPLNRGKLYNIGFTEAQRMKKNGGWRCIIFHDQDLVPTDTRNLYRCSQQPEQLVANVDTNKPYKYPVGGAIAISPRAFSKLNGFSNLYFSNDAVYDDFYRRLQNANFTIKRRNATQASYIRINASISQNGYTGYQSIQTSSPLNLLDGLSTLTYTLIDTELKPLYTLIEVDHDTKSHNNNVTASDRLWNRLMSRATLST